MVFSGIIKLNKRGYALIGFLFLLFIYFHFNRKASELNNEETSLLTLLHTAVAAAKTGGSLVVSSRNNIKIESKGQTKEGMEDSVTTADYLSHCAMKRILTSRFPKVKFISEEKHICDDITQPIITDGPIQDFKDTLVKTEDVTIWIDPLDATLEYTEKLYQYVTTMVCIAIKGEPIIGIIHSPFNNTTSWAVVGSQHSKDLNPLPNKHSGTSKVIVSRSHSGKIKEVLQKNFNDLEVITAAGAGYKVLQVAKGQVDAYIHITAIKKWDICAGNAILNALGGRMTTKNGKNLVYHNETDVVNKEGLVATVYNQEMFINKLD